MSGNVLIICITIIICGVLLAFCHYNEHKEDLSTDRFEYLVQQIEILKRDLKHMDAITDQMRKDMDRYDSEIMVLDTRITSLGKLFDPPNTLE